RHIEAVDKRRLRAEELVTDPTYNIDAQQQQQAKPESARHGAELYSPPFQGGVARSAGWLSKCASRISIRMFRDLTNRPDASRLPALERRGITPRLLEKARSIIVPAMLGTLVFSLFLSWVQVSSDTYIVKSSAGEERARRVLKELEDFDQLLGATLVFRNTELPELPIEVLLLGDEATLK